MLTTAMRLRLLAVLLTIPLTASGIAGVLLHVCQSMGGVVVGDCDCVTQTEAAPSGHEGCEEHAAAPAPAKWQGQPCCEVELANADRWVAAQKVTSERIAEASLHVCPPAEGELRALTRARASVLLRERGPPNAHGPPIYLRHCSLLN